MTLTHKFARAYATAGIPIFPLNGKQPATRHGLHDATTNLNQVDRWFANNEHNIGLPVPQGSIVLDWDPRSGPNALQQLKQHGELPATTTCISGRGDKGRHLYYRVPEGRYTDRNLPDGIDIRVGGRHYCVAAPSVHPDSGGHYYWTGPEYMADIPRWLLDLIRPTIKPVEPPQPISDVSGHGLIKFVAELTQGNRNQGVFWSACTAIQEGIFDAIKQDLKNAALSVGLAEPEIDATFASAVRRMQ